MWSIIPAVYVWLATVYGGMLPRQILMSILVTIWSVRLTFNFARKGGFPTSWKIWQGEEDYRWAVLRKNPTLSNPFVWWFFNLSFISIYQSFLICSFTFPIVLSVDSVNANDLNIIDLFATLMVLGFIVLETVADQQQWEF